jgi:hypothetical protein
VHVLVARVVVEREADLVALERDRSVDIVDGQHDDLKGPIHQHVPPLRDGPRMVRRSVEGDLDHR